MKTSYKLSLGLWSMTTNHLKYLIFRTCITSILLAVVTAGDRQADVCQFLSCLPRRRRFCPPAWKSFCRRNPLLLTLLRVPRIICTVVGVCLSRSLLDVKDSQALLDSLFCWQRANETLSGLEVVWLQQKRTFEEGVRDLIALIYQYQDKWIDLD